MSRRKKLVSQTIKFDGNCMFYNISENIAVSCEILRLHLETPRDIEGRELYPLFVHLSSDCRRKTISGVMIRHDSFKAWAHGYRGTRLRG